MNRYIYCITNKINNKKYIGQHSTSKKYDYYMGSGLLLNKAFEKYGKENFEKSILCHCQSKLELNEKEIFYIKYYKENNHMLYNISDGGTGGKVTDVHPMLGKHHSEEAKIKMRLHFKGMSGRNHTKETRLKQSESAKKRPIIKGINKGKKHTEEFCMNIRNRNLGKKDSDETKLKKSVAMMGHLVTKETGDKISKKLKNKKKSEEHKLKLSSVRKNTKYMNNGIITKIVKIEDINKYLFDGWFLGILRKQKKEKGCVAQ